MSYIKRSQYNFTVYKSVKKYIKNILMVSKYIFKVFKVF
jgi:hypothetical protein